MDTRVSKEAVAALLKERKFDDLAGLVLRKRGSLRYLNRLLYAPEELTRRQAIEGMGIVADRLAGEDPEAVRVILRTLLWTINDESGGIGWSAPECMGEIIYRRPEMFKEFASIVLSYIDEPMLRRSVLWAAGRIGEARPELVREAVPELSVFLDDPDPVLRGYTLRFLGILGEKLDVHRYGHLRDDRSSVPVYESGRLKEVTVADLAAGLLSSQGEGVTSTGAS